MYSKGGPAKNPSADSESSGSTSPEIVEAQPFRKSDEKVISKKRLQAPLFNTVFRATCHQLKRRYNMCAKVAYSTNYRVLLSLLKLSRLLRKILYKN